MIHTGGLSTFSPFAALKIKSFFSGAKVDMICGEEGKKQILQGPPSFSIFF